MVVVGYGVLCLLVIFGVLHAVFLHLIDVYRSWVCWWIMLGVLYLLGIFSVNNVSLYIYLFQHQCIFLCYPPVALLAFAYLKILWVV